MVRDIKKLGDYVKKGEVLAEISSPTGTFSNSLIAPKSGVIIGKQNIPLVQEGDAMFHVAIFETPSDVAQHIEQLQDNVVPEYEVVRD
jgi:predicted deacylase